MQYYFIYTEAETGKTVGRDEAIRLLRSRTSNIIIRIQPSATPIRVRVTGGPGLLFMPQVQVNGWGYQEPAVVERIGLALVEAAKLAADAENAASAKPVWREPAWLHERNNDPYGTPRNHGFWETVHWARQGDYKYFERDGYWYAYDVKHNAWYHFDTAEACWDHVTKPAIDPHA